MHNLARRSHVLSTTPPGLLGNNGEAQLWTEGQSHTHLVNCDLLDNTAPRLLAESTARVTQQTEADGKDSAP